MRIGHLVDGGQGFWVSFDGRGSTGYHTRYWNEAKEPCNFRQLQGKVKVEKELELSNFSSRKKTTANKPQILKQKLLIRKIYLQGGVLYEGNVDEIEAVQAEKDQLEGSRRKNAKLKSGITKNTTPKKPKIIEQDSKSILDMFKYDACNLPTSPYSLKKLRASWKKLLPLVAPPTDVLLAALTEAQTDGEKDGRQTTAYLTWCIDKGKYTGLSEPADDETSDEEVCSKLGEDDESDEGGDESEGSGEDEGHEHDGDQKDGEEEEHSEEDEVVEEDEEVEQNEIEEEQEVEQEEVMEGLDTPKKKDDSDDSDDGGVGVGLHGSSGPSEPVLNPDASGVSTPTKTSKHPWELVYRNYNYKP